MNDIGLLKLESINNFLKIYSQISKNNYKNESDKLILTLFSYFASISKNDQKLYDLCKNIIDTFSNNQFLNRYKGIKSLNNIFTSKLHSRYNLFLIKLIHFINKKRKKYFNTINRNNFDNGLKIEEFKNSSQLNLYNNRNKNKNNFLPKSN